MFRTKTTIIVGAGAGYEIEMPDAREMLTKIAAGFDFARLGTDLQTRDMILLSRYFENFAPHLGVTTREMVEAANLIRNASRVSSSIDAILEQHAQSPLVQVVGKLAIVHYTLQAEGRSPLTAEPRDPGDLPLRGNENWLYQISRMVVGGVPSDKAEECFGNLSVISFNYDRALEHYLPWFVQMAFGMPLEEARALVAAKLNITYPLGNVGRLPWAGGDAAEVEWGVEEPQNLGALVNEVRTVSQLRSRPEAMEALHSQVASGGRLVFLGFGFDALHTDLLTQGPLEHDPEVLVALAGMAENSKAAILRTLKQIKGSQEESGISMHDARAFHLLRDYAPFLES